MSNGESSTTVVDGFTITGGRSAAGAGIFVRGADPRQAEVVRRHGLDKGNFSRIYRRELQRAQTETRRRLAAEGFTGTP